MIEYTKKQVSHKQLRKGKGLLNSVINKLPFELHLPGYQYCGPETKLKDRLARGDPGVNPLDRACREHDIAYALHKDTKITNIADLKLAEKAWERVKASDSKLGERVNSWLVTNIIKSKAKLGMGMKQTKQKPKKSIKRKSGKGIKQRKLIKNKRNVLSSIISNVRAHVK